LVAKGRRVATCEKGKREQYLLPMGGKGENLKA